MPAVAAAGPGITGQEQALAKAIQAYGKAAVPRLLDLLDDNKPDVRALAAYALRDISGLSEGDVPRLLKALARGEQWVAPALGRIGSPAAIGGLFNELDFGPQTDTQVTYAFKLAGSRAVPTLLGPLDCRDRCNNELLATLPSVFGELGSNAAGAVGSLD